MTNRGMTLLELMTVLTIIGILTGLATLGFTRLGKTSPEQVPSSLLRAHLTTMRSRSAVRAWIRFGEDSGSVLILPDGRVLADSLDPFGGATANARP